MKIGILTMHRVVNYGSALQAYALQHKLESMGYEAELIDYVFPTTPNVSFLVRMQKKVRRRFYMMRIGKGFSATKERKFRIFRDSFLKVSNFAYNRRTLIENPPCYDVYMVGSDQVWNPQWIKNDPSFFLTFVRNGQIKVSYASSFTVSAIEDKYKDFYASALEQFQFISVREKSGVSIVHQLIGKNAELVCDPTILLSEDDYEPLIKTAKVRVEGPYILAYILGYMFNPFPEVNRIISSVCSGLELPVVYLDGNKYVVFDKSCRTVSEVGPCEFLWLIKNASFVITSSYHGCIFSSIFNIPFMGIVKKGRSDDRIVSLLWQLGNNKSLVYYDSDVSICKDKLSFYLPQNDRVNSFRNNSIKILTQMLEVP